MHKYMVGDKVWVVPQKRNGAIKDGSYRVVCKVGRLYGYLESTGMRTPFERFDLITGCSNGGDRTNSWMNYRGFDVYPSREVYENSVVDKAEHERLFSRLVTSMGWCSLVDLSPQVVKAIHKVLDEEGISNA